MGTQENRRRERRSSFRCSVSQSMQEAKLTIGRRAVPARLLNESSGGFAAVITDSNVATGDLGELLTAAGRFKVKVTHASPVAAEPGKEPTGEVILGLQRLGDAPIDPPSPVECIAPQPLRAGLSLAIRRALLAFAISMVLLAALVLLIRKNHPLVQRLLSWQSANCPSVDKDWIGSTRTVNAN
jgi:hypothetical protein